jgi:hypothetical protein
MTEDIDQGGWVNTFGLGITREHAKEAREALIGNPAVVTYLVFWDRPDNEVDFQVEFVEFRTESEQEAQLKFMEALPGFIEYTFG